MGVCAVENSMLFILDIIISFTQITGRGGAGVPCCGLKAKGVDTQSETGNTANDILWEVQEHVLGNWFILNLTTEFAKERQSLIPD